MAGLKVVSVKVLDNGNLDLEDLRSKAEEHRSKLAAFMVIHVLNFCHVIHGEVLRSLTLQHSGSLKMAYKKFVCNFSPYFSQLIVVLRPARSYMITEAKSTWTVPT